MSAGKNIYSIQDLLEIMRSLRHPDTGCSWDKVQTFESIAPYTVEEAYEVSDAIERHNMDDLCEELGDLLLQVVYHSEMASEKDHFNFSNVVDSICNKMIRRHPHVFGSEEEVASGKQDWEQSKKQEMVEKGVQDNSILAHVPNGLPPLIRARKLQKKAAKANFDWVSVEGVVNKLEEELNEVKSAIENNSAEEVEEEIGDLLFSVVNLCRHTKHDADYCLQKSNAKFESRFRRMEALIDETGNNFRELDESQLDHFWHQSKRMEKSTA